MKHIPLKQIKEGKRYVFFSCTFSDSDIYRTKNGDIIEVVIVEPDYYDLMEVDLVIGGKAGQTEYSELLDTNDYGILWFLRYIV